jgi:hypothetical protein
VDESTSHLVPVVSRLSPEQDLLNDLRGTRSVYATMVRPYYFVGGRLVPCDDREHGSSEFGKSHEQEASRVRKKLAPDDRVQKRGGMTHSVNRPDLVHTSMPVPGTEGQAEMCSCQGQGGRNDGLAALPDLLPQKEAEAAGAAVCGCHSAVAAAALPSAVGGCVGRGNQSADQDAVAPTNENPPLPDLLCNLPTNQVAQPRRRKLFRLSNFQVSSALSLRPLPVPHFFFICFLPLY